MNRSLCLVLVALALAACQPVHMVRPDVPVPDSWPRHNAQPADSPALSDRSWDEIYPLPELSALIDEALAHGSDLRIALERVELARAQYGLERAARFPTLSGSASATRQRAPGFDPNENQLSENAALTLAVPSWEIDLWGKLAARTEAARREVLASDASAHAIRVSVAAQVASLYLDLLDLDNQLIISKRTNEGRHQALKLTRARFEAGISSILDVRQAESLIAASAQAIADQRRRLALTENALSVLLGRNPGLIVRSASLDTLAFPARVLSVLPSELLLRRPDILSAEESLRGAEASIEAARKAYLPSISLTTTLGFISPDMRALFDGGRDAWSVQPALALPIFTGGRLRAGVESAEAAQRIVLEQYRSTIRQAFREVSDALAAHTELSHQREAALAVAHANRERLRIANARYLAGITSYFEVLDAERQLFDSELGLSQTTRAVHQAVVQLYRALGGGWTRPAA